MALIELKNVTKLYKSVIGVNDMSLSLEPGIYGLLGPNGSGKTTMINLILGQLKPTIGSVTLFGKNPWKNSHLLRQIGLCPALEVNYPKATAFEWVTYLVQLHGIGRHEAQQRALEALRVVRMEYAMDRPMRNYSLGMRQRTKLAQAIAHDPEFLILDEPFNGLDPVGRFEMISFLKEWAKKGKSLILASHILHEVEAIQPSFLLISGGRLLASGPQSEIREILADSPCRLMLATNFPKRLATLLIENCPVHSIELGKDGSTLVLETQSAAKIFDKLPQLIQSTDIQIYEMTSQDDSLNTLFSTLMQIHRGETRKGTVA